MIVHIISCLLFGFGFIDAQIKTKVLSTAILHWVPNLKLHHVVLLSNNKYDGIYTLDFSPINQSSTQTLLKLFFAKNVPGEIRIRNIKNIEFGEDTKIIDHWNNMNSENFIQSQKLSQYVVADIQDSQMKQKIVHILESWDPTMNLYTHNCQHFSKFIQK